MTYDAKHSSHYEVFYPIWTGPKTNAIAVMYILENLTETMAHLKGKQCAIFNVLWAIHLKYILTIQNKLAT